MWTATILVLALALAALGIVVRVWRRVHQLRTGGVDVALRSRADEGARGWHLGVARYRGEEFTWYRVLSLRNGPSWVMNRSDVAIAGRREPTTPETYTVPSGSVVLDLDGLGRHVEIAMGPDALTGFLSWLESAPPGKSVPWAS
ncbi:DUF2550 family protein [Allosaccharopolyspora coralli]|uniref:DUF2550 family protein n=1 Tax=Allosaccharopolyspora coralli TaxID=2665642 RepID=A0A5Q3Q9M6_9PSEU|nr:DUF2550 domain-containing protein [Allosaccharopolyspora coralli]QGK71172.1 DUF2550 family protein [Allosaccharopolyspora coralli]